VEPPLERARVAHAATVAISLLTVCREATRVNTGKSTPRRASTCRSVCPIMQCCCYHHRPARPAGGRRQAVGKHADSGVVDRPGAPRPRGSEQGHGRGRRRRRHGTCSRISVTTGRTWLPWRRSHRVSGDPSMLDVGVEAMYLTSLRESVGWFRAVVLRLYRR